MPHWLRNQLMKAFLTRDSRQIRLLNDCWYFYRTHNFHVNSEVDSN
ncbi:cortex morphogenetic protein CmpA [Paenibacillus endoradicis]|uniref:Cortex morphogenetic protein CmpA n=1 Tax=Candidatus Pristimantibacillus lignocellulolyticus TaxID=2994561 RepID=A0A9J6ZG73_9BACL|nr:cortex morphogenetic protein CmpA [Paenibacillus endoradicis]MCR8659519.1 cortex morphogenetic protein CmpA [Paenibacillus endoradicis]URN94864.1 MAG: cortex morphogenetic protein CmpA [Candidatus Pristimantibacillus lignocellulolyticus]